MQQMNMKKGELEKERSEELLAYVRVINTLCIDYCCLLMTMQSIEKTK